MQNVQQASKMPLCNGKISYCFYTKCYSNCYKVKILCFSCNAEHIIEISITHSTSSSSVIGTVSDNTGYRNSYAMVNIPYDAGERYSFGDGVGCFVSKAHPY